MVLVASLNRTQRIETLLRSIDFAFRDLLREGNDPVALALYLWVLRQHKLSLINSDDLARWGEAWVYRIFVEGHLSRKKDEQITSAALANAVLSTAPGFSAYADQISQKIQQLISSELDLHTIPFNRPSYGAILLFASTTLHEQDPRIEESAKKIISVFREAISGGRAFGFGFAMQLLQRTSNQELFSLEEAIYHGLEDPKTNYEDQLYLLQALWLLHDDEDPTQHLAEITEQVLRHAPVWPYLMAAEERTPSTGDEQELVAISHFYRAILLDVSFRYQYYLEKQAKEVEKTKHRGRYIIRYCAFGFGIVLEGCAWLLLAWKTVPSYNAARRYWLLHEYTAMTSQSALLYLVYVLLVVFLLFFTPVFTWTWGVLLLHSKIEDDRQIAVIIGRRILKILILWLTLVVVVVLINLITGVFGSAFQHAIGG